MIRQPCPLVLRLLPHPLADGLSDSMGWEKETMSEHNLVSEHAQDVNETVTQTALTPEARRAQAMLMQRRQVLKAAALAAPLLVTLRARSVYAGGGGHSQLGSTGINYGPGSYGVDDDDTEVHEPGKKKKKKKWGWWW